VRLPWGGAAVRLARRAAALCLPAVLVATGALVTTAAPVAQAAAGGTVVVALPPLVNIDWYEPLLPAAYNSLYDSWAADLMYQPLLEINGKGAIDYADSVASSIGANAAGTVFTVHLNPKWHWSDGSPVTAKDLLFTWNLIKFASSSAAPTPWPYADAGFGDIPNGVRSVRVTGTYTFQMTLDAPANQLWFEYNGLSQLIPLPAQSWDKFPNNMKSELAYLTTNGNNPAFFHVIDGAFAMKSATENQSWIFVPNPKYSGHRASIGQLVLAYQTSDQAELNELRAGEIQVGYLPQTDLPAQKELTADRLVVGYGDGFTRIFLDFGNPQVGAILRQLPVRQAMAMGINQAQIIQDVYHGYAVPGASPVPSSQPSLLAPSLHKPAYPFSLAAGKATLEHAGWHEVNGVMQNAKGQKLTFVMQYVSGTATTQTIVQLLQSDWAQEGIKVTLDPMPFASMVGLHDKADAAKWQIQAGVSWDWGGDYPSGEGIFQTGAPYNFYQFSDPTLDRLIQASIRPYATTTQSVAALRSYQVYVSKILPVLWMPYAATLDEVARNLGGVNANTLNLFTSTFQPQYWTISQ